MYNFSIIKKEKNHMSSTLKEYRCKYCNKLFFKGDLKHCTIEVKCKNCKEFNVVKGLNCQLVSLFNESELDKDGNSVCLKENEDIKKISEECLSCGEKDRCNYFKVVLKD